VARPNEQTLRRCRTFLKAAASALSRLEDTSGVTPEAARRIGLVSLAAHASAIDRDVRLDFAYPSVCSTVLESGAVYARAKMRSLEFEQAIEFILEQLDNFACTQAEGPRKEFPPKCNCYVAHRRYRGEIAHVLLTGVSGRLSRVKIKDPSFHNWQGLFIAVREKCISDFPFCKGIATENATSGLQM